MKPIPIFEQKIKKCLNHAGIQSPFIFETQEISQIFGTHQPPQSNLFGVQQKISHLFWFGFSVFLVLL